MHSNGFQPGEGGVPSGLRVLELPDSDYVSLWNAHAKNVTVRRNSHLFERKDWKPSD